MKSPILLLSVSLAVAGVSSAHAQISRPVANGTALGALAGALIGGHNHDRWGEGAIIGAAAGALLGAVVDQPRPRATVYQQVPCDTSVTVVRSVPATTGYYQPEPCAPQGTQVVYVQQPPQPRVVYVQQQQPTRVVYVQVPPRVVIVEEPRHHRRPANVVYVTPSYPRW